MGNKIAMTKKRRANIAMYVIVMMCLNSPALAQVEDTIRVGHRLLKTGLAVGVDAIESYSVTGGVKKMLSYTARSITRTKVEIRNGEFEDAYKVTSTVRAEGANDASVSIIVVRKSNLAMIRQEIRTKTDSGMIMWHDERISGWKVLGNGRKVTVDTLIGHPVFPDDAISPWLLGQVSLNEKSIGRMLRFNYAAVREIWSVFKVEKSETLTWRKRPTLCWKVDAGPLGPAGYRMVRWIEKSTGLIISSVLQRNKGETEYWSMLK